MLRYEISNRGRPSIQRSAAEVKSDLREPLGEIEPINRESMEQRVEETLRELIVTGQLPEGTPLVQRDLAQRLGVSQTPVRVGLSALERGGLVEVGQTGRALVSRLTREDFEEIYAARLGLEGLAARVGVAAIGDAEVEQMRELMADLNRLAKRRVVDAYLRTRWDFHALCYDASGRTRLVAEVERLFWRAERYNRLVLSSPKRFQRSVAYYHEFLEACERRDVAGAERVIHESIRNAVELLWPTLPSERELEAV